MEKPKKFYKVSNEATPIYITLNESILSDTDLDAWNEYKKTIEYLGRTDEEKRIKRNTPEPIKMQAWGKRNNIGTPKYIEHTLKPEGDYMRCVLIKVGTTYVNERQVEELKKFEKKPIVQDIKYGEKEAEVQYEGFLTIEEISDEEYSKVRNKVVLAKDQT